MTPLAALIAETASMYQDIERAEQRIRRREDPRPMPTTTGALWRALAACKRELEVKTGKAELLDELMRHGIAASECRRRWDELEAKRKGTVTV